MNSSECYRCHKTGHFARECTSSERGGGYRSSRGGGGGGYRGGKGDDSRSSSRGKLEFFISLYIWVVSKVPPNSDFCQNLIFC